MPAAAPRLLSLVGRLAPVLAFAPACSYDPYETAADDAGVELTQGTGSDASSSSGGEGSSSGSSGESDSSGETGACADACEADAAVCEGDGVARCEVGDDGCLAWTTPEPCPEGHVCAGGACSPGPGFMAEPTVWAVPKGGRAGEGFAAPAGEPAAVKDDAWELFDIDGDGALDLVLTAAAYPAGDGFLTRTKGYPFNPFWQVYRGGTSGGFGGDPHAWLLPLDIGLEGRGLVTTAGEPGVAGEHVWALRDVDGDGRPDLVVTGVAGPKKGEIRPLGAPEAPRWDIYFNTGDGFAATPHAWVLPLVPDGLLLHHVQAALPLVNGPSWALLDLDADGWSDIVITGRSKYPKFIVHGFPNNPYWEVYRGGPEGFVEPALVWMVPQGGGAETGFAGTAAGIFGEAKIAGDQSWALIDVDGDKKLELVVTGQLSDPTQGPVVLGEPDAPVWAIHRLAPAGFEVTPELFAVPEARGGAGDRGFHALRGGQSAAGSVTEPYDASGWEVLDVDADGRLDLVVTNVAREIEGGVYKREVLGGETSPYWDVYRGTTTGFGGPERWPTPTGGLAGRGFLWSRGLVSPVPEVEGTVLWHTGDLDGDRKPELIVTAIAAPSTGEGSKWGWQVPGLVDGPPHWLVHWQWAR